MLLIGTCVRELVLHAVALGPAGNRGVLRRVRELAGAGPNHPAVSGVAALSYRLAHRLRIGQLRVVVDPEFTTLVVEARRPHPLQSPDCIEYVVRTARALDILDAKRGCGNRRTRTPSAHPGSH